MLNTGLKIKFQAGRSIKVFLSAKVENAGVGGFITALDASHDALGFRMEAKGAPLFAALRARMEWLSERQKLLSENIANADTPGYQVRDLKPVDFHKLLKRGSTSQIAMTNPLHLKGAADAQRFNFKPEKVSTEEVNPSGNSVSIEEQMVKLGETQMEYETATSIYRKQAQLLKLALGSRN